MTLAWNLKLQSWLLVPIITKPGPLNRTFMSLKESAPKDSKKSRPKEENETMEMPSAIPGKSHSRRTKRKADGDQLCAKGNKKQKKLIGKEKKSIEEKEEKIETESVKVEQEKKSKHSDKMKEKEKKKDGDSEKKTQHNENTDQRLKLKKGKEKKHKSGEGDSAYDIAIAPETNIKPTAETGTPSDIAVSSFLTDNRITIQIPPGEDAITPILSFDSLPVTARLQKALLDLNFRKPTPIQSCTWPALLKRKDVIGIAETGSGKTFAFGVPALSKLIEGCQTNGSNGISTLVLAPTRELAIQTYDNISALGAHWGVSCICLYGGVDKDGQRKELRSKRKSGAKTIVVGTPGRILDLIDEGNLDLSGVKYLVLDEADRMLDHGFENDIKKIIGYTSQVDRQTVMFSATWPESVRRLASSFLTNPVRVIVGSEELAANGRVEQIVEVFDDPQSKDFRLLKHLKELLPKTSANTSNSRILIFALYKAEAARLNQTLERNGYSVASLHGNLSQSQRMAALEDFKLGRKRLMVATDVAARGLDIAEVEVVINYTFPLTVENYVHRIGRTGRAGRSGKSITFFTGEKHETGLAGELAKVLRESGFQCEGLKKFPMAIKKKEHSAYGAFYKDISKSGVGQKIKF